MHKSNRKPEGILRAFVGSRDSSSRPLITGFTEIGGQLDEFTSTRALIETLRQKSSETNLLSYVKEEIDR